MLSTIIEKLRRTLAAPSKDEAELLAQFTGENPADLLARVKELEARRDANDARWQALDRPHDQGASRERRAIEDRGPDLQNQIDVLRARIAVAEARRAAFLELTRLLAETDDTIATLTAESYARVLVSDVAERRERLVAIDAQVRLRSRVAGVLASASSASTARRLQRSAPDPLTTLADDLRARADEIERFHSPGMPRAAVPWPAGAQELIDALTTKGVPV